MRSEEEVRKNMESLQKELDEIKEAKEAKLNETKQERYDCVKKAYETYEKLRDEYTKDYGYFTINTTRSNNDIDDFFSRIFR